MTVARDSCDLFQRTLGSRELSIGDVGARGQAETRDEKRTEEKRREDTHSLTLDTGEQISGVRLGSFGFVCISNRVFLSAEGTRTAECLGFDLLSAGGWRTKQVSGFFSIHVSLKFRIILIILVHYATRTGTVQSPAFHPKSCTKENSLQL